MSPVSLVQTLYADAPPHVSTLALTGLAIAALGVGSAFWGTGRYVLALRTLSIRHRTPVAEPFNGVLDVLNLFTADNVERNRLSADAVWEVVTGRLQMDYDAGRARVRFLAYLPLLVGLAATMLGLAGMIDQLGLGMSVSVRANLRGVFLGTLAGIGGSAIVGLAGLVLGATGTRVMTRTEHYLHQHVLPALPDQRIALRIEEAVLQVIAERSEQVVGHLRGALQPLAETLKRSASDSASAAASAVQAFQHAVVALRDSGDLRAAATIIGDKLIAIEHAATHLGRAALSVKDATALDASMRLKLSDAAAVAARETESVVRAGQGLDARIASLAASFEAFSGATREFKASAQSIGSEVSGARQAFTQLADSVKQRNDVELARIDKTHHQLEGLAVPLVNLHGTLVSITAEVANARAATERFRGEAAEKLALNLDENFKKLAAALESVLTPIARLVPGAANQLSLAASQLQNVAEDVQNRMSTLRTQIEPKQRELKDHPGETQAIVSELREGNRLIGEVVAAIGAAAQPVAHAPTSDAPGAQRDLMDAVRELKDSIASLRSTLMQQARLAALKEAEQQAPQGWFRRFRSSRSIRSN